MKKELRKIRTLYIVAAIVFLVGCNLPFKNLPGMVTPVSVDPLGTSTPFQPGEETIAPLDLSTATSPLEVVISPTPTFTSVPTFTPFPSLTPAPTNTAVPTLTSLPTATTVIIVPTEAADLPPLYAAVDRTRYLLNVSMDQANHFANISESIYYTNRTGYTLQNIVLGVNSNLWKDVFILGQVTINDLAPASYDITGQWLTIGLLQPIIPGETIKIGVGYSIDLPYSSAKVENFGYTTRQTNLIDWYPFIPPFENGNWVLPDPYGFGENLVYDKADFFIDLSFTDPYNQPVVAASSGYTQNNGIAHYELTNARNFSFSMSYDFLVQSSFTGGVEVQHYYFPEDAIAAGRVLDVTTQSIATYSEVFGPYPHTMMTVVETELNDGLETDGLYFLSSSFYKYYNGSVQNNLSVIAIHETAHQWWYGSVASNQATEPWLDESMATYSELIFFENNYPDLLQWWWNFRVYSHNPAGWVDSPIYSFNYFADYVNAVYFNGAEFIHLVRQRIGDQAFYQFIAGYYNQFNGSIATTQDFLSLVEAYSGQSINDLVADYFYYQ